MVGDFPGNLRISTGTRIPLIGLTHPSEVVVGMFRRFYSSPKLPRFAETLKEASKPAVQQSVQIAKPFGLETPRLVGQAQGTSLKHQLFSSDAKEQRQKALDHDIAHLPFYESKSFENTGGKIFTPPISFFKRDRSRFFPDFLGDTLSVPQQRFSQLLKNKISIVRIFSTISGDNCSRTYFESPAGNYLTDAYKQFSGTHPHTQLIDLNMPQTAIKRFFVNMSKGNLRKLTPPERHGSYFILPYKTFPLDVRQQLYCDNVCSGYVYVLDDSGRIRWATSGLASEAESALMWKCVAGLERELKLLRGEK